MLADCTVLSTRRCIALDAEAAFLKHYTALRAAASRLDGAGALVAAVGHDGRLGIERLDAALPYVVIGRHPRAHLRLHDPAVSLRHVLVRLGPGGVEARDLRTPYGFSVSGFGEVEGISSRGHLVLHLASALVMILPGAIFDGAWPADASIAWRALPADELAPTRLTPISSFGVEEPGVPCAMLTLESRRTSVTSPVTAAQLRRGVLVGRYARCELGNELWRLDSWSRVHLALFESEGEVRAYDTASTAGTVIDALHVDTGVLGERSVMALGGEVRLVFERG